ncbi:MAG: hypothetical protein GF411_15595 [Candidatus Lokiarchaeota archaeon]|nr:hypothetical protein [Candidatus Lokiarchaeota archaeon]
MLQWTPEIIQLILEMAEKLNESLYPFSVIIPLVSAVTFVILIVYAQKNPGNTSSTYLKILFAIIYVYSGLTILLMIGEEAAFAIAGGVAMWGIALLLVLDAYWKKATFTFSFESHIWIRIIGVILIISGIVLYPIIEIVTGHVWPAMVLFTAECPTTISLIGLYLTAVPKTNKLLLAIISLNAAYTGFAVALAGFLTDALYGIAGVFGILALIIYWKEISFLPLKEE